ncbi:MAG: ferrochelatase [Chlamydiae bacterium RIFCSPHIGHO2_12_FULL_49_9]|nr:MAG: ferrochelatase [Chlamydiae bacterium RIFCSPHIGHO2_12_FULL_49_9]
MECLLVNFGGPRDLNEVAPFLVSLLQDQDVIRTKLPPFAHRLLFGWIARRRALKVRRDYALIGGKSPIYFDTEELAKKLNISLTFHRYLPSTHAESLEKIERSKASTICVLPLFPQFCYATTGSIARFFSENLSPKTLNKLRWIKSYAAHPAFIRSYQKRIADYLQSQNLKEEESLLFFSAHGVPKIFIEEGDIYQSECELSFKEVMKAFPKTKGLLAYQSKFGRGEWLRPYTNELCEEILSVHEGRKNIVFIPISFTSDHIETLFEIEEQYLPPVRAKNLNAFRCPSLNLEPYWIEALSEILQETNLCSAKMLIRFA